MLERVFNDRYVRVREADNYLNANDMLEAMGKRRDYFSDWCKGKAASAHILAVSAITEISVMELVDVKQGGNAPGTWIHPDVALRFAMDLNAYFGCQVILWVRELLTTGSVELANSIDETTGKLKSLEEQYDRLVEISKELEKEKDYYQAAMAKSNMEKNRYRQAAGKCMAVRRKLGELEGTGSKAKKEKVIKECYDIIDGKVAVDCKVLDEGPAVVPPLLRF